MTTAKSDWYGIQIQVYPFHRDRFTVIEMADDDGTETAPDLTTVRDIVIAPPSPEIVYSVILPWTEDRFWFRAHHRWPGLPDSTATGWVDAEPDLLGDARNPTVPQEVPRNTPMPDDDDDESTKVLRIHSAAFVPESSADAVSRSAGYMEPGAAFTFQRFYASPVLPASAIITAMSAKLNRASNDTSRVNLARPTGLIIGFSEGLADALHDTVGWRTIDATMTYPSGVSADEVYVQFYCYANTLNGVASAGEGAALQYVDISYTITAVGDQ